MYSYLIPDFPFSVSGIFVASFLCCSIPIVSSLSGFLGLYITLVDNVGNSTSGYGNFDNVIGFRLIKAMVPNSIYTVNDNNKNIIIQMSGSSEVSINLTSSSYTFNE